jgi:hypothetical protein
VSLPASGAESDIAALLANQPELLAAVQSFAELDSLPVSEHHSRLAAVHEVLHRALDPMETAQSSAAP